MLLWLKFINLHIYLVYMDITADFGNLEVLERTASKFGNGCHVFVSKMLAGKKAKIIFGKCGTSGKKIKIDFFSSEILERKIKSFGTGAHIIVPKEYSGKKIKIIVRKNE